eukprot:scaffold82761_cov48-Phaeocystis_antarctica.AAC.4
MPRAWAWRCMHAGIGPGVSRAATATAEARRPRGPRGEHCDIFRRYGVALPFVDAHTARSLRSVPCRGCRDSLCNAVLSEAVSSFT